VTDPAERAYPNGVNGLTGDYLTEPLEAASVAAMARASAGADESQGWLAQVARHVTDATFGVPFNVTADDPASAGWGIVFSSDATAGVRSALQPLIDHRRDQLGEAHVKVLDHMPGEAWADWLARHGVGAGTVDPGHVPYYLLLVGDPGSISFETQWLLDVEYAVGRLDFDDADAFARYAASVIAYETSGVAPRDPSAAFFATRHDFDRATQASADLLATPLATAFAPGGAFAAALPSIRVETSIGAPSTREALAAVFAGIGSIGRPALLFTATHGIGGLPAGHPGQRATHGALLCQDWSSPGSIDRAMYFTAADLPADADVHGLVAFFFACYGAGTPAVDPFVHAAGQAARVIAPAPFVAALPKALLSHPRGGALAVIGHVERAWSFSFLSASNQQLLVPFENAIGWTLLGKPIGYAMKDLNEKYAVLSANLAAVLEDMGWGARIPDEQLASLWLQRNDAQNYILLGDPAVRLKVA